MMTRYVALLLIGIVIGYFVGFGDARTHRHNVVVRVLDKAGGAARGKYSTDLEAREQQAERGGR